MESPFTSFNIITNELWEKGCLVHFIICLTSSCSRVLLYICFKFWIKPKRPYIRYVKNQIYTEYINQKTR